MRDGNTEILDVRSSDILTIHKNRDYISIIIGHKKRIYTYIYIYRVQTVILPIHHEYNDIAHT